MLTRCKHGRVVHVCIHSTTLMDVNLIIQAVREASLEGLDSFARSLIQEQLPTDYIETLSSKDKTDMLRACLLVYILTATTIVPRQFQLEAILATLNGRDIIINDRGKSCFNITGKEEFRSDSIERDMEALFDLVHFTVDSIADI